MSDSNNKTNTIQKPERVPEPSTTKERANEPVKERK
jgi:hypothetical protein